MGRPYRFINFPVTECWSLISAAARWDSRSDFQYNPCALDRSKHREVKPQAERGPRARAKHPKAPRVGSWMATQTEV